MVTAVPPAVLPTLGVMLPKVAIAAADGMRTETVKKSMSRINTCRSLTGGLVMGNSNSLFIHVN
jgi:hypothetical protein